MHKKMRAAVSDDPATTGEYEIAQQKFGTTERDLRRLASPDFARYRTANQNAIKKSAKE